MHRQDEVFESAHSVVFDEAENRTTRPHAGLMQEITVRFHFQPEDESSS